MCKLLQIRWACGNTTRAPPPWPHKEDEPCELYRPPQRFQRTHPNGDGITEKYQDSPMPCGEWHYVPGCACPGADNSDSEALKLLVESLKDKQRLEHEQRLKDKQRLEDERRLKDEQRPKEDQRLQDEQRLAALTPALVNSGRLQGWHPRLAMLDIDSTILGRLGPSAGHRPAALPQGGKSSGKHERVGQHHREQQIPEQSFGDPLSRQGFTGLQPLQGQQDAQSQYGGQQTYGQVFTQQPSFNGYPSLQGEYGGQQTYGHGFSQQPSLNGYPFLQGEYGGQEAYPHRRQTPGEFPWQESGNGEQLNYGGQQSFVQQPYGGQQSSIQQLYGGQEAFLQQLYDQQCCDYKQQQLGQRESPAQIGNYVDQQHYGQRTTSLQTHDEPHPTQDQGIGEPENSQHNIPSYHYEDHERQRQSSERDQTQVCEVGKSEGEPGGDHLSASEGVLPLHNVSNPPELGIFEDKEDNDVEGVVNNDKENDECTENKRRKVEGMVDDDKENDESTRNKRRKVEDWLFSPDHVSQDHQ